MSEIIIGYADAQTGNNETRQASAQEAKVLLESQANAATIHSAESQRKAAADAAREELLVKLGITAEEAELLFGKAEQSTPIVAAE
jgi:hypothetical protein